MSWSSRASEMRAAHTRAVDKGLIAAAQILVNEVKRRLRGGYTSGAFTKGIALNSVSRSEPFSTLSGERGIQIGTFLLYPLFWELGHANLFTGRFERQERWVPAMLATREQQADAFSSTYVRTMKAAIS